MPLSPNQGSTGGCTLVTITGTNLSNTSAVKFGTKQATNVTNVSPTQVTALAPAGAAGTVTVTLTTTAGVSNGLTYTQVTGPAI
ncbi:IPT/TIG domain-containing protein [Streptomyces sp. NBC_00390]|uniref:IPT/TIG domain-containing protein n=1 Tax=Streptomyces sp. NBC_00390 TaxID=2975736 RepID=UPI002E239CCB